jgi:ferric-dicitrate binding protein FerR (iron transport regulator)
LGIGSWELGVRVTLGIAALTLLVLAVDREGNAPAPAPALAIAAQVVSASGSINSAGRPLVDGDSILLNAAVQTAGGARATLRLADGVEVRLDTGTEVVFPVSGAVTLTRGGAFFDTGARRGSEPIEVRTAIATVHDIGTRFEVRLIDNAMRVRVRDGIVQMHSGGASRPGARGTELLARQDGSIETRPIPITGADWDWVAPGR